MANMLPATVDHYLAEWGGSGWARAFHSLIELGPEALPFLVASFRDARAPALRVEVVEIARAQRSAAALPFFAEALLDASPPVWKAALDGIVGLATPEAIRVLEQALCGPEPVGHAASEFRAWVEEALGQTRAAAAERRAPPGLGD